MTPELHLKAKQLFLTVCELGATARRERLDELCAGDPALRAEVESLLQYHVTQTLIAAAPADGLQVHGGSPGLPTDRWCSGSMVAGRYRIVHQLGKGGMGEVYRVEDVTLSRPAALKFITAGRGTDPVWLNHFLCEARIASTITHRHVCRIYDIGEADGEAFLSMEYIDGEDLANLLRRVGRLTPDKAGELARQLCLGLAAIHERGTLHRDLKPANVMIDGRGEVRITDFGIAVAMEAVEAAGSQPGTPRYMAPEVTQGKPASVQSDLYSLGLILHHMVTGRHAFDDVDSNSEATTPLPPPSEWAPELDSSFEQTILRCLEPDPQRRPRSAFDVLAGLPGGEVLGSMVAAGELPPVEVVAQSRTRSRWNRVILRTSALVVAAGLLAALLLADKTMLIGHAGLVQPPDVLADRAKQILQGAGYDPAKHHGLESFAVHHRRWERTRAIPAEAALPDGKIPRGQEVIGYRYALMNSSDPSATEPAFIDLFAPPISVAQSVLDGEGRLLELDCRGVPDANAADPTAAVDWSPVFALAGFDLAGFQEVAPSPSAATVGHRARAWEPPAHDIRVETAEHNGRILRFSVNAPGEQRAGAVRETSNLLVFRILFLVTLALTIPMAWHNVHGRRSDRRGALKLGLFVFAMQFVMYSVQQTAPATPFDAFSWLASGLQTAVFMAFLVWLYYVALEPHVRRYWPQALISWARSLTGQMRDPLVGRDVVLGCAFGVVTLLIAQVAAWMGLYSSRPYAGLVAPMLDWHLGRLSGYGFTIGSIAGASVHAISRGFLVLALMLLLRLVTKRRWAAVLLFFVVVTIAYLVGTRPLTAPGFVGCGLLVLVATVILDRVGFLPLVVGLFVTRLLLISPLTLNMKSWYAGQSVVSVVMVLVLAGLGLYASRTIPSTSVTRPRLDSW